MRTGNRRIDRILEPSYLDGLTGRSLADVRRTRAEVEEEEALLSYERRLLQGRLDILGAERERRATGGDAASIIERLPQILAGQRRPSRGAIQLGEPPSLENPRRRVEKLVSDDTLAGMSDLSDEHLGAIVATLENAEREVSDQRGKVLDVLDALTAEIGRRYRSGEASPEDILTGGL